MAWVQTVRMCKGGLGTCRIQMNACQVVLFDACASVATRARHLRNPDGISTWKEHWWTPHTSKSFPRAQHFDDARNVSHLPKGRQAKAAASSRALLTLNGYQKSPSVYLKFSSGTSASSSSIRSRQIGPLTDFLMPWNGSNSTR